MKFEKVDLNLFVVFDAIYRERNVTRVAQSLQLTQPAVSNALSRLRSTFDDPLFVRTPGGMAPTPVAHSLVGDIREALSLLRQSVEVTARFELQSSEKVFHLGMNDLAESLLLPRLHAVVKLQAPKTAIASYYVSRDAAVGELKAGTTDLLVDAPVVNAKELSHLPLLELPYIVALRPGHPLAGKSFGLDEYLAANHLHVSSRRQGRGQVDIALHGMGLRRRVAMRVQNYLVAARITQQTDLIWTVPSVLVPTLQLESVTLPFSVAPLKWCLYWHRNADNDPANQWMRNVMLQSVTELGASGV